MMSTRRKRTRSLIIFASGMVLALQIFVGCKPVNKGFSGEMAYNHVEVLVNFGPREPGTEAIGKAQNYIEKELNGYGWKVLRQSFSDETPIGLKRFVNLRARYSPDSDEIDWKDGGEKILICSHYDTKIMENINFLGANDGGSSTGVLIELGRVLSKDSVRAKRIELVFFDGTLWQDDEMIKENVGIKTGKRMGHISMSGEEGSIEILNKINIKRKVFIHINTTNPSLLEDSDERKIANENGWEIAYDTMEIKL